MTEETHVERVYEYGPSYCLSKSEVLSESIPKTIHLNEYQWLLKYTVSCGAESTTVNVSVDFKSRYVFSDQATLVVTVMAAGKQVTKEFDIEKTVNQHFSVDLTNGFSEVKTEDLTVTCMVTTTKIQYTTETIGTMAIFTSPERPHDVVLLVGERKFYVHKLYLATWSKYFDTLFYGNFAEKDKKEVKLEDVDSAEFEELLHIVHPEMDTSLDDDNVLYLLKLADRFDMPSVMAMCGKHLMDFGNCPSLSIMDRLQVSDKYSLVHVQLACLKKLHKKTPAEFTVFLEEHRADIRTLSSRTIQNLI